MITNSNQRVPGLDQNAEPSSAISFVIPANQAHKKLGPLQPSARQPRSIAFQSKTMREFHRLATRYARSSASVLITGESGTGKELFSRFIHQNSQRAAAPFVAVNCAAIPESLIESELFGHERGAFTGAGEQRVGYFERANQGTLLLDEISEIPIHIQAKLLRVIEEQEVQPIGANHPRAIDVRLVATTNRDLQQDIKEGRFREDLYHRLNVVELSIPPLRERVTDIPLLVMHFVSLYQNESLSGSISVSKDAMQQLCEYHWPGNVRELRNIIHRACIVADDDVITANSLPQNFDEKPSAESLECNTLEGLPLADVERKLILACLDKFKGNKRLAAEELGVTARTLSNKLKLYQENGLLSCR